MTESRQIALEQTTHAGAAAAVGSTLGGSLAPGSAAVSLLSNSVVVQFGILRSYSRKLIILSNLSDFFYRNYVAL